MKGRFAPLTVLAAFAALGIGRNAAAQACVRPTDSGGFAGYMYDPAPLHFDTSKVRVWYAVSGTHSVRTASTRSDGVPDDVASVGSVTEDALNRYAQMGYRAPISDADPACGSNGGDGRLDVYLVHFAGADGTTTAERCQTVNGARQCASFILAEANFEGRYATADEGIHTVLPHETFHTVQNAYDADCDRFWAEGSAQWAAKTLDPALHDLERNLPSFFEAEGRSIDAPVGGVTAGYLYGAAIWPVFLEHHYDANLIREIFEQEGNTGGSALDAARAVLDKRATSLDDAWPTFWSWNASTGARADGAGLGYPDAATYPQLALHELDGEVSGVTSGSSALVYHLAASGPVTVSLVTASSHRATVLPMAGGKVDLSKAAAAPTNVDGEALIVLTSLTASKVDAPYTLKTSAAPASADGAGDGGVDGGTTLTATTTSSSSGDGCAMTTAAAHDRTMGLGIGALVSGVALILRRRRPSRRR